MVAPRAHVFRPLVKGNEALGTRLAHIINITCSFAREISIVELQSLLFFRFGLPRRWKDKKKIECGAVQGPVLVFKPARHVCVPEDEKTLIYHTAVLVARKVKILSI